MKRGPSRKMSICHPRGILCNECNQAIGLFKDSVIILENAIQYLSRR